MSALVVPISALRARRAAHGRRVAPAVEVQREPVVTSNIPSYSWVLTDAPASSSAARVEPVFPPTLDDYLNGRGAPTGTDPALAIDFATQARDLLPAGRVRDRLTAVIIEAELLYTDGPEAS